MFLCKFYPLLYKLEPIQNFIIAWTVSPEEIINKYERETPNINSRVSAIKEAINQGWKVRLCFDPLLYIEDFENVYGSMLEKVFESIDADLIQDVSLGVFRISKEYIKSMRRINPHSMLINYPFHNEDGVLSYSEEHKERLISYFYESILKYFHKDKIFI